LALLADLLVDGLPT